MKSLILTIVLFASSSALACIPKQFEVVNERCTAENPNLNGERLCISKLGQTDMRVFSVYYENDPQPKFVVPVAELFISAGWQSFHEVTGPVKPDASGSTADNKHLASTMDQDGAGNQSIKLTEYGREKLGLANINWSGEKMLVNQPIKRCGPTPVAPVVPFE